ncbi:pre-60S factor rei1 [Pleurotus ostreatus]|nr:pre-60S factor rei1 [Pleurotus ostreatus]
MSHSDLSQPLFTCLSCSIAFPTAEDQRVHYRSDHHRYNMKRRVASLPPVSAAVFAQKLQERQQESTATAGQLTCEICNKTYTTEGAYRSHVNSKRHKEIEAKVAAAEKIVVGNFCIYCNEKGRDFRTLEAARKHMIDKGHCKIAYDTEDDRLEISDYYDFSSSYPPEGDGEEWEDVDADGNGDNDDDMEVDEVVDDSESETNESNKGRITYSDSDYELVLPSGARIGHRSMRRYYAQSFTPIPGRKGEDPNSGAALVRRLLADKNSALVPRKGGFGAYGSGTDVIKARNRGEAREAGRHVREFRDQKRREDFKTKVGYRHNSQKHFRDPLLQVSLIVPHMMLENLIIVQ